MALRIFTLADNQHPTTCLLGMMDVKMQNVPKELYVKVLSHLQLNVNKCQIFLWT